MERSYQRDKLRSENAAEERGASVATGATPVVVTKALEYLAFIHAILENKPRSGRVCHFAVATPLAAPEKVIPAPSLTDQAR